MYAKIFSQIFDSTLADNWKHRHVFEDLLKLADQNGLVDMTPESIIARTRLPSEMVFEALDALMLPDPRSRTKAEEGRRIVLIDPTREWGWRIVNYVHYRGIQNENQRMSGNCFKFPSGEIPGYVYYARSGDLVKIGFSRNPWARMNDFKAARPGMKIVATERTTNTTEQLRHKEFSEYRTEGEWFRLEGSLLEHVNTLRLNSGEQKIVLRSSYVVATSASESASASVPKEKESEEKPEKPMSPTPESTARYERLRLALHQAMRRKPNQHWDYAEMSLLCEINKREGVEDELTELLAFQKRAGRFFPHSLYALLSRWSETLDQSRQPQEPNGTNHSNGKQGISASRGTANEGTAAGYANARAISKPVARISPTVPNPRRT